MVVQNKFAVKIEEKKIRRIEKTSQHFRRTETSSINYSLTPRHTDKKGDCDKFDC